MTDNMINGLPYVLPVTSDVTITVTKTKLNDEHIKENGNDHLNSFINCDNILKKQKLLSFSHLLDFRDIVEHEGTILLPNLPQICSNQIPPPPPPELRIVPRLNNNIIKGSPALNAVFSSLSYVKSHMDTFFSSKLLPQPGLLVTPKPLVTANPSMMRSFNRFASQEESQTDDLKATILSYLLQEGALNPVMDMRHSTMVRTIQAIAVAFYFRKNVSDIMHTVGSHSQLDTMREALSEFKQELATHLACGTAVVTLGDIFDGKVTDLWFSLGCIALLLVKSKMDKQILPNSIIKSKAKLEQ